MHDIEEVTFSSIDDDDAEIINDNTTKIEYINDIAQNNAGLSYNDALMFNLVIKYL